MDLRRGVAGELHYCSAEPMMESGGRSFTFVASTSSVDRYSDVIEQDWDLREFWKNPILLWAHQSRELPIGRVTSFEVSPDRTRSIARAEMEPAGKYPFADLVTDMLQRKALNAVSVGFIPTTVEDRFEDKQWKGFTYKGNKLVELSVVTVPANAEAVQVGRSLGLDLRQLRTFFHDPIPAAEGPRVSQRRALEAELELLRLRRKTHIDRWTGQVA